MIPKVMMLLISVLSTQVTAATPLSLGQAFEPLVLRDFNSILSETYNEGEGTAEAVKASCRVTRQSGATGIIYCTVEIQVQPSHESTYRTSTTCTSMGYQFDREAQSLENFAGWRQCIESVNNITEF